MKSLLGRAPVAMLILAIRSYQLVIAPFWLGRCRHYPSCSKFAIEALQAFGLKHGTRLAVGRILRCRPGGTWGYDPVEHRN